ncbi:hypothetical protein, partial [Roseovarius sp. SYSU LYC5161]|uniref:hypothetical protein n=1 Tax=Roseovarius halophilus (ex Wu et al. 2025) TaxID=3376060 RepID=UPI003999E9A0
MRDHHPHRAAEPDRYAHHRMARLMQGDAPALRVRKWRGLALDLGSEVGLLQLAPGGPGPGA